MKKSWLLIFALSFLLIINSLAAFAEEPSVPGSKDMESIQKGIDQIPIGDDGGIDKEKVAGMKSKAELRIEAIDAALKKTDKYFLWVFGIPLRLSWEFTYLFFLVLLSLSIFHNIPIWLKIEKEWVNIILAFGATFLLSFFRIFQKIVNWIILITNKWWWNLVVIGIIIIFIVVVGFSVQIAKKRRIKAAQENLVESSKKAQEEAEHIGKVSEALTEGLQG